MSVSNNFKISPVADDELRDVVEMLFYAYDEKDPFVNAVYPHKLTENGVEGLDTVVTRLQWLRDNDPTAQWIKVTDASTGEIVSASQWNVYENEKPPEQYLDQAPTAWWTDETEKKYGCEMCRAFSTPRYLRYRELEAPIICLNIMGTAKKYLYKGAANMQVERYVDTADKLRATMTTESTSAARWLYEKHGFVVSKDPGHFVIEASSKEFVDRPKHRLFFMERPRRTQ